MQNDEARTSKDQGPLTDHVGLGPFQHSGFVVLQIDLSPREFRMIRYFLDHSGEIVSREALLNSVWGYDSTAFTRTVDTHMARLRQKVESVPSDPRHLITIHRVGYKYLP